MFAALLELVFYTCTYETNTREKEMYIMENILFMEYVFVSVWVTWNFFYADYGQIHKFLHFIDIHYNWIKIM